MVVWCGEMEKEEKTREGRQKGKAGQRSRATGVRLSQPIPARQCASGSQLSCGQPAPEVSWTLRSLLGQILDTTPTLQKAGQAGGGAGPRVAV